MTQDDSTSGILVPEHRVPAPKTVSPQAQAFLSQRLEVPGPKHPVGTTDKAEWRAFLDESERWLGAQMKAAAEFLPAKIVKHDLDGLDVNEVVPNDTSPEYDDCAIFYLHGGAYTGGAGVAGAYMGAPFAVEAGIRAFCVDYRMPPEHPFPAGLNDTITAYKWMLETHASEKIAVAGGSAGGGLAAAFVLKARDLGLPMPGACVLSTPEADLTESGDSFETNIYVDVVASERLTDSINLYADGHDLRDPYLSPLFGDFSKGFSPTILTCGTRDLFLSNTVLMHRALRRAGMAAELHVWEGMPHGGFFGAPEDQELLAESARFIKEQFDKAK